MKKKFLIVMFAAIVTITSLFCVAGCNLLPQDNTGNSNNSGSETVQPKPNGDKHTHSLIYRKANDATCTQNGNIEYWECSGCSKYFSNDKAQNEIVENQLTIEKRGHDLISHEGKEATCKSVGWEEYETCKNCDYSTYSEIEAIDHVYVHHICKLCSGVDSDVKPTEGLELTLFAEEDGSSAYAVTGIGTATDEDIVLPKSYKGLPVTKIGEEAFRENNSIKSVILSKNIKLVESAAFWGCKNIESVVLNDGLQKLDDATFRFCKIVSVSIPQSVNFIGVSAFYNCRQLKDISLPENLKYIGNCAFADTAFYNNDNNWENGLLYINNYLFASKSGDLFEEVKLKNGTSLIADFALRGCSATSVSIPNSVKYINECAFWESTSKIIWGDSPQIEEFEDRAFSNYENEDKFVIPNSVTKIGNCAFQYAQISSVEIPSSVKTIGDEAFIYAKFKEVQFNEGLTSLGHRAFAYCSNLTHVTLPKSLKSIPEQCFQECGNLTTINLGNELKEIGGNAFQDCDKLSYIKIPASVEFIGSFAFSQGIGGFILKDAVLENKSGWKVVNYYDETKIKYPSYSELLEPAKALRTYNSYNWYRT